MYRTILGLFLLTFFGNPSLATSLPDGVKAATANLFVVCDRVELTAKFRDDPTKTVTRTVPQAVPCGSGFQVSASEVLTAAHVLGEVKITLMQYFLQQQRVHEVHRGLVFADRIPVGNVVVTFYHELISATGHRRQTEKIRFTVAWNNQDPTKQAVQEFVRRLFLLPDEAYVRDATAATAMVTAESLEHDLALFTLSEAVPQASYISVSDKRFPVHTLVWGLSASPPGPFSEGKPLSQVNPASLRDTAVRPEAKSWPLGPNILAYSLSTEYLNYRGVSGGPNVDASGRLVGVTHAANAAENHAALFDVRPPCNRPFGPRRSVFNCTRYAIPGYEVNAFLVRARN